MLAPGVVVAQVRYTIARVPGFLRTGTTMPEAAGDFRTQFVLPAGENYALQLEAQTTTGKSCTGSATFDIFPDQRTALAVVVRCNGSSTPGTLQIDGILNMCPYVTLLAALPDRARVGEPIVLHGLGLDDDGRPSPLSYAWTASSGSLTAAASPTAGFACSAAGTATITLSVSDGDVGCTATNASVAVTCLEPAPPSSAGAGSAGVTAGRDATGGTGEAGSGEAGSGVAGSGEAGSAGSGGDPYPGAGTAADAATTVDGTGDDDIDAGADDDSTAIEYRQRGGRNRR